MHIAPKIKTIASLILTAFILTGTAIAEPDVSIPKEEQKNCKDDTAHKVFDMLNEKFGGPPKNSEDDGKRWKFVSDNHMDLYDENHDGFIEFPEYVEEQWYVFVPYLSEDGCRLTREGYIRTFTELDKYDPTMKRKWHELSVHLWGGVFDRLAKKLGRSERGYLTKADMTKYFKYEFDQEDFNHDGKLTPIGPDRFRKYH